MTEKETLIKELDSENYGFYSICSWLVNYHSGLLPLNHTFTREEVLKDLYEKFFPIRQSTLTKIYDLWSSTETNYIEDIKSILLNDGEYEKRYGIKNKVLKLTTPNNKSYWDSNGVYQKEYEVLAKTLVPDTGEANTINGEMIRVIGRLTYDFCNNGNCNVISHKTESRKCDCSECNGRGVVDEYNEETEEDEEVDCGVCGGSGETYEDVDGDAYIESFYEKMVDFLEKHLTNKEVVKNLRAFLLDNSNGYSKYKFDDNEMRVYNELADAVIYQCLTTENVKRQIED